MRKIRNFLVLAAAVGLAFLALPQNAEKAAEPTSPPSAKRIERSKASEHRPPLEPVTAGSLGIHPPATPIDHARKVEELLGRSNEEELNLALLAWFQADAKAARSWLESRKDFTRVQPALKMIADDLASRGEAKLALAWADLLEDPRQREEEIFSIMAAGRRDGCFTDEELRSAKLPEERIHQLLSGVAND